MSDEDMVPRDVAQSWKTKAENLSTACKAQAAEIEKLEKAMKVQASAVRTLQANEETEINILRQQKREWHQAVSSLDSEREANAILTAEIEKLREDAQSLTDELAYHGIYPRQALGDNHD